MGEFTQAQQRTLIHTGDGLSGGTQWGRKESESIWHHLIDDVKIKGEEKILILSWNVHEKGRTMKLSNDGTGRRTLEMGNEVMLTHFTK